MTIGLNSKPKCLRTFFFTKKGISHIFSSPYTAQQNCVVERRNRSLCETARTMLSFVNLPLHLWVDAVRRTWFTIKIFYISKRFLITPYDKLSNCKPNMEFFHVFGCMYFLYNLKETHNKFDVKVDEALFLGYSLTLNVHRVLNKMTSKIKDSYYVTYDDKYIKSFQKEVT